MIASWRASVWHARVSHQMAAGSALLQTAITPWAIEGVTCCCFSISACARLGGVDVHAPYHRQYVALIRALAVASPQLQPGPKVAALAPQSRAAFVAVLARTISGAGEHVAGAPTPRTHGSTFTESQQLLWARDMKIRCAWCLLTYPAQLLITHFLCPHPNPTPTPTPTPLPPRSCPPPARQRTLTPSWLPLCTARACAATWDWWGKCLTATWGPRW